METTDTLNWTESQAACAQLDPRAHLAVITSEQQNDAIVNYTRTTLLNGWLFILATFVCLFYNFFGYCFLF